MSTSGERRGVNAMKLLAGLCGVFAIGMVAPAAATATAGPVGVGGRRRKARGRGSFAVPVWTDEPGANVTTVTATIRDGGTTVATVPLAPQLTAGFWAPARPLRPTEDGGTIAALGHYAIDVSATDSHADTTTRADA